MMSWRPLVRISPNLHDLSAVENEDEEIAFWGQKVKGQGHGETHRARVRRRRPSS